MMIDHRKIIFSKRFEFDFIVSSFFTKKKEVFMKSTDRSWKPSVNFA
jgi:hypothetical protein